MAWPWTLTIPSCKEALGWPARLKRLLIDHRYSGGRDGVICAWNLNLELSPFSEASLHATLNSSGDLSPKGTLPTTLRQQVQAHTHWINDICLAQNNEALVSASSDITIKVWRPGATDALPPQTIGLHSDYVKCLASPGPQSSWVASGALDRKIYLWDLNGAGQQLQINVGEDENTAKGSVYALAVTPSLLAAGGPESIVRVWDPRSGKRVTKLVGHTDNIRDILISQDGDTIMTASSDQTVKVWSMSQGRCMYTLTMHNDSVWSLYSDHPRLSLFYSSDRSGLIAKTDTRGYAEIDEGLSVAICQEHEGVSKVVSGGDYIWTATSSASINRWKDIDTEADIQVPESYSFHRASLAASTRSKLSPPSAAANLEEAKKLGQIPLKSVLRLSNAAPYPVYRSKDADTATLQSVPSVRKASEALDQVDTGNAVPFRTVPDYTVEGQHGLVKHATLNDRRRVLTVDTAGEVTMWDLLKCMPVQAFGKRHLDDVLKEVNTTEAVAHWCSVDTRTGSVTCVLEENTCFDAEMYADELDIEEKIEFREDQRINLGKWVLRYLFDNLIDEEIKRDEVYRKQLLETKRHSVERSNPPSSIQMPPNHILSWNDATSGPTSATTLKPINGVHAPVQTPGLAIGLATPGVFHPSTTHHSTLPPTAEEGSHPAVSSPSHVRTSSDRVSTDYFSTHPTSGPAVTPGGNTNGPLISPSEPLPQAEAQPAAVEKTDGPEKGDEKKKKGMFGSKKLGGMGFGLKSLKKEKTNDTAAKPAIVETPSEDSDSRSSKTEDRVIEDNFLGAIQRMRLAYEDHLAHPLPVKEGEAPPELRLESAITPSLPSDTPVLKPPMNTTILIQEDRVDAGGVADLFEGSVGSLAGSADLIEKVAPMWLADCLLRNQIPPKDIVKVSFILEPIGGTLPSIASDGYVQQPTPSIIMHLILIKILETLVSTRIGCFERVRSSPTSLNASSQRRCQAKKTQTL